MVQLSRSARRSVEKAAQTKYVTPTINSRRKYEKLAVVAHVLQNTQNSVISRCCFAEDGQEMYKDLYRTCTAIVLLIKSFV